MPAPPEDFRDRDEDLVRRALDAPEGDLRAFEELVVMHQRRILANCRFLTRDPNNAEDLSQEVFVKAFFALSSFEGRSSFRHWLQRIKVNHCLNHLKRRRSSEALPLDEEAAETVRNLQTPAAGEERVAAAEKRRRIARVLDALPDTLRVPLVMRDMDELSYEEIAQELSIGLSAVKMRIKRARERFRHLYEETQHE